MSIYDTLNEQQREAVFHTEGPLLILAGAGSGKTRVLTHRIAYLIEEQQVNPWNILAITFTNKAAGEMRERVDKLVGYGSESIWVSTFHSMCVRILRRHIDLLGYDTNFTIYDSDDQKTLMREVCKLLQVDTKMFRERALLSEISKAKDELVTPQEYRMRAEGDYSRKKIAEVYEEYEKQLRSNNALDFDDLLFKTVQLFQTQKDVLEYYQERFRYIMVDEYQDTNYAQHSIVLQLTKENQRVCVVGDDAQSIYSFRGADIDNILYFTKIYPNTKVFKLEQNYRSTQTIVCAANSLIEKNERQIRKAVFSEKEKGEPIGVFQAYSDVEEGDIVANKIAELRREYRYGYADFAILYRTNAQSRILEEALRKRGIPYKIYGGLSFYQRKEIKDVIAYFRLAVNPNDEEAFKRVINYPARGIGNTTLNKIIDAANVHRVSLWKVLNEPLTYGVSLTKGTHTKLQAFRDLIAGFVEAVSHTGAYELGKDIVRQSGIINDIYQDRSPENLSRQENIEELINGMHDFCAGREEEGNTHILLTDYLSEVSLLTDQDSEGADDAPKVTLMTIHSAKGLEFKNVFVVGLEENLFPSPMAGDSYKQLEEERRLFYVAITRAEEHCFLSFAKTRFKYGKVEFSNPSRFLKDIDARYLNLPQEDIVSRKVEEGAKRFRREMDSDTPRYISGNSPSMFDGGEIPEEPRRFVKPAAPRVLRRIPAAETSVGTSASSPAVNGVCAGKQIEHERFGIGEIIKVEGSGDNCKATVRFRNAGEKQLLLKFARFKIIE